MPVSHDLEWPRRDTEDQLGAKTDALGAWVAIHEDLELVASRYDFDRRLRDPLPEVDARTCARVRLSNKVLEF